MILVVTDLYFPFPGGAERLIFNLARDLMRRGHDVQVVTGYHAAEQGDGPPVTVHGGIGVFDRREEGAAVISEILESTRPDVILTHHLYARQFSEELLSSEAAVIHVILNGDRIPGTALDVFISSWVKNHAGDGVKGPWARSKRLFSPYNMVIRPPVFPDVVAESHGYDIGFMKPIVHKGVELFYRIAEEMPDRRFVVLRGEWQTLEVIRDLPNVYFMEPVRDIRDFWRQCRLVLVPSISEDAGTVAQEATANGVPCISSNVDGLAETNGGGVQLPPDSLSLWVQAIVALDDPVVYGETVARQVAHLAEGHQDALLDRFAEYVQVLELNSQAAR